MSLFGGPLPARPAGERDQSASPVPESLPPSDPDLLQPQDQPNATRQSQSESGSEVYSGTDPESETRPNRYHGPARTWRHWTANDRQTVTSLDQIEAGDLSLHLYNAHALHRRVRSDKAAANTKYWHSKSRWNEAKGEDAWVPPKGWTAWPMEPEIVPRAYEKFGRREDDFDDTHTFRRNAPLPTKPSQDMEDILLGLGLKHAKIRWESRQWDVESSHTDDENPHKRRRADPKKSSIQRERSMNADSTNGRAISHSEETAVQKSFEGSPSLASGSDHDVASMPPSAENIKRSISEAPEQPSRKRPRRSRIPAGSKPVVMADDDKAHEILQPLIRSTLTKLEEMLMALHRSRQYDVDYDLERNETSTDAGTEVNVAEDDTVMPTQDSPEPGKRKLGRPPKAIFSKDAFATTRSKESKDTNGTKLDTGSTETNKGRPKQYERLPGESYYMMHKRLAQEQANGTGHQGSNHQAESLARPNEESRETPSRSPKAPKSRRRRSSTGSSSNESDGGAYDRNSLRDWSSVLGNASLSGFDPAVIARTAKRCTALFGEAMTLRMVHEDQALYRPHASVEFRPDLAPSLDQLLSEDSWDGSDEEAEFSRPRIDWNAERIVCPHTDCERHNRAYSHHWKLIEHIKRKHHYDPQAEGPKQESVHPRPAWDGISLFCPHEDCTGHTTVFTARWRLVDHIKRKHGYDPNEQLDPQLEEDELVGGVHNDGFMRPITRKSGWKKAVATKAKGQAQITDKRKKTGS